MHGVMSLPDATPCNHLAKEERAACFILIVILLSCGCSFSVPLPRVAVGWSVFCECGIFLIILNCFLGIQNSHFIKNSIYL